MKDMKANKTQYGRPQMSISLKQELREKIKKIAKIEHRSFSAQAALFLGLAVSNYNTAQK